MTKTELEKRKETLRRKKKMLMWVRFIFNFTLAITVVTSMWILIIMLFCMV